MKNDEIWLQVSPSIWSLPSQAIVNGSPPFWKVAVSWIACQWQSIIYTFAKWKFEWSRKIGEYQIYQHKRWIIFHPLINWRRLITLHPYFLLMGVWTHALSKHEFISSLFFLSKFTIKVFKLPAFLIIHLLAEEEKRNRCFYKS